MVQEVTNVDDNTPAVVNNEARDRFEIHTEGKVAFLRYSQGAGRITLIHTEVPDELGGRGLAGRLAASALDYARARGLRVTVLCPFVASYVTKHPEYADLIDPE